MLILLYIYCSLVILILIWHFTTIKYINKNTMDLYLGNKGCGKSSTEVKYIIQAQQKGETCYANAEDIEIVGLRVFDTYDLGKYRVSDAHIFIDELSLYFDNRQSLKRNSANNSQQFIAWLREIRHLNLKVDMFSQSYDCDKKIRTMCDNIYIGTRYLRVFTVWRRLRKNIAIKDEAMTAESQIVDELNFTPWWMPGSIKITYIPKYIKYYDSYKDLQKYESNLKYKTRIRGYKVGKRKIEKIEG